MEMTAMASCSNLLVGTSPSDLFLALGEVQGSHCYSLLKVIVGVSPLEALFARVLLKSQCDIITVSVSLTIQNWKQHFYSVSATNF